MAAEISWGDQKGWRKVLHTVGGPFRGISHPFENLMDQLRFHVQAVKAIPAALHYRKLIAFIVSDITIGAGALIVGAGTFFVIFAMSFFTGTQVGLEGFQGLSQIGAQSFVGLAPFSVDVQPTSGP